MKQQAITILLFLLLATPALATIGVNTASITFDEVLAGGYAQQTILLSTNNEEEQTITITTSGTITDWLSIPEQVTISKERPEQITIHAQPPSTITKGLYEGTITLHPQEEQATNAQFVTQTRPTITLPVKISITDEATTSCVLAGLNAQSIEEGMQPIISYTIRNSGNTQLQPTTTITIRDRDQTTTLYEETTNKELLQPTSTQREQQRLPANLPVGQYWVSVQEPSCGEQTTTFDVLTPGTIADRGELTQLLTPQETNINEITTIRATFRNRGSQPVTAQLQGTITHTESQQTNTFTSQELVVMPGQRTTLQTTTQPRKVGEHEITARISYNQKVTGQETKILFVNNQEQQKNRFSFDKERTLQTILFTTIILLLVLLIHKKKNIKNKQRKKNV